MPKDQSFHDYVVHDILTDLPAISSKSMFGGWGIYQHGVIFAIIADGELYFKIGDHNRAQFEAMNSHPFTYSKKDGKTATMQYWLVPEEVLEDRERLYALTITPPL